MAKKVETFADIYLADGLDLSRGFEITGIAADDRTGNSVSFAGDFNGDGVDDVVVGSSSWCCGERSRLCDLWSGWRTQRARKSYYFECITRTYNYW